MIQVGDRRVLSADFGSSVRHVINQTQDHHMRDKIRRITSACVFVVALLIGSGAATPAADLRLVEAVRNQDEQRVRTLLNQRIDVNARSSDGSTALLWAAHWNAVETAGSLIRAGADPNAAND